MRICIFIVNTYYFLNIFRFLKMSCISMFCIHACICSTPMLVPEEIRRGIGSPETGVLGSWYPPCVH